MANNLGTSVVQVYNVTTRAWVDIPPTLIRYETYKITPNQVMDLDSYRGATGQLLRTVLPHTATKIEFETPYMEDKDWKTIWGIISAGFANPGTGRVSSGSDLARSCRIRYWDPYTDTRKTAWVYVPDIDLTIRNVDFPNHIVNFEQIRIAFIEY